MGNTTLVQEVEGIMDGKPESRPTSINNNKNPVLIKWDSQNRDVMAREI